MKMRCSQSGLLRGVLCGLWLGVAYSSAHAVAATNAPDASQDGVLTRMRELAEARKSGELIEQFKDQDFSAWPPAFARQAVEACTLRGQAYARVKNNERAEKDLNLALKLSPSGYSWHALAEFYKGNLNDSQRALDAYNKAFEVDCADNKGKTYGWMPLSATMNAATILISQEKYPEALRVMGRYEDSEIQKLGPTGSRMLRVYGMIYACTGREEESLAKFKAALELENRKQ